MYSIDEDRSMCKAGAFSMSDSPKSRPSSAKPPLYKCGNGPAIEVASVMRKCPMFSIDEARSRCKAGASMNESPSRRPSSVRTLIYKCGKALVSGELAAMKKKKLIAPIKSPAGSAKEVEKKLLESITEAAPQKSASPWRSMNVQMARHVTLIELASPQKVNEFAMASISVPLDTSESKNYKRCLVFNADEAASTIRVRVNGERELSKNEDRLVDRFLGGEKAGQLAMTRDQRELQKSAKKSPLVNINCSGAQPSQFRH